MATIAEISAAIDLIEVKKQNLHKSFLHLQSQSPSSFNLPLQWADLDSYFTSLHSSLQSKFNLLQTLPPPSHTPIPPTLPQLKSLCLNSDGLGLTRFIANADQSTILAELPDAYRCAPDPPSMVLDAAASFYTSGLKGAELRSFRSACSIMLIGLIRVKPHVSIQLKDKAMEMALRWNQLRVSAPGCVQTKEQEALGLLLLVGAYELVDRFGIDDVIDCILVLAKKRNAIDLFRRIFPENKITDVIRKLIDKDMHVTAVTFSIQLQKTDEFTPVGLLEERKLKSMMVIEEARRSVDLSIRNDVMMREIDTLKSIIECIDENHLQSEYPKDSVVELVYRLESEVENSKQTLVKDLELRKQPVRASVLKKKQLVSKSKMSKKSKKSKKRKLNNVRPTAESAVATPLQDVTKLVQVSHSQKSDLSPDHVSESHSSPLGSGPTTGSNAPYTSPNASPYGSAQADTGYNSFVPQLHAPVYNSNGWISD